MRVAVRVDAGPLIGGGHAMRCLALADVLAARGADVTFVSTAMPKSLCDRIEGSGHRFIRIPTGADLHRECRESLEPRLDEPVQVADASATATASGPVDWVIVDQYRLDEAWHSTARNFARNILVIDDLANRRYDCDLLVDQTFGRDALDYADRVTESARVLAGPKFALLRPEFQQGRSTALDRRKDAAGIDRILIAIGMTDFGGLTSNILDQVLAAAPRCKIDVALGPNAQSLQHVTRLAGQNRNLRLHLDCGEMARLMRDADLAIGAAGCMCWERSCLGLPAIALVLAKNQRSSATALANAGSVIAVDEVDAVGPALRRLVEHPEQLEQMIAAAFPITDGEGALRVAAAMFSDQKEASAPVELRPATPADMELLWLWRNDPVTRTQSRKPDPISWRSHVRWVTAALADPAHQILIGERFGTPVGNVGFHPVDGDTETSIVVAPQEREKGVGRAMLSEACARQAADLYAAIRVGNKASRRLFETCGFNSVESREPGFVRYLRRGQDRVGTRP